ncbi:odorant receptor 131-2-like [Pholidichthys leucotaenia]
MFNISQSHTNATADQESLTLVGEVFTLAVSTAPTCVFLFINGTMLYTLRSKPVFRETCRYILLYNLLAADTLQLAQAQVHFYLSRFRVKMIPIVCVSFTLFTTITGVISPLTLVLMPMERYIAVCYPLRHSTIITTRNTGAAIAVVWAISSLNVLIRHLIFLEFSLEILQNLEAIDYCSNIYILLGLNTDLYDKVFTCFVFISAGVSIIFSYIGVIAAARAASTDKTLARNAKNTVLLNLIQLSLSLSITMYNPIFVTLSRTLPWIVFKVLENIFYVFIVILPRCLSALIYGLRDQTLKPVLISHLCCQKKLNCSTTK